MKRIKIALAVVAALFPLTLAAQSQPANEVGAFVSLPSFDETTLTEPELDLDIELSFDEKAGYGVSYNRFWLDQFSTEFAVQKMSADMEVSITEGSPRIVERLGEIDLTAFSGTAQWHFARQSRISPYVGAGVAYLQGEVETESYWSGDPLEEPVPGETFDLESETTWLANAGVNFNVTPTFTIALDAKYMAYEPKGEGESDDDSVDLNPLVLAAGLKFRF